MRRPKQDLSRIAGGANGLIGSVDLVAQEVERAPDHSRVGEGVVAQLVPRLRDAPTHARVLDETAPDQEEGRLHLLGLEEIEHLARVLGGRPIVEGEGDHRLAPVAPPDGVANQLERRLAQLPCRERRGDQGDRSDHRHAPRAQQ